MRTIWKFPLEGTVTKLSVPKGAKALVVQLQGDVPCLWAEVESRAKPVSRVLRIVGTGHEIPEMTGKSQWTYVDTFQQGPFVWHVYELTGI